MGQIFNARKYLTPSPTTTSRPSVISNCSFNEDQIGVCMVPMYCDCVVCTAFGTLSSCWTIEFLIPMLQRLCRYGSRKSPYYLRLAFEKVFNVFCAKVSKGAKIRNRYIQVPHLTQDTNGKGTNSQLDTTNECQEVTPFPARDHKAQINRRTQRHKRHKTEKNIKDPHKKYCLGTVSKIFYWRA